MNNVQSAQDLYDAFNRGDIATVLGMFDPGIEWREAEGNPYEPSGSPWIGGEAITQNLFMKIPSDFDGFTVHPKEFHDAGDTVVVPVKTDALSIRGIRMQNEHIFLFKVRDGRLVHCRLYADTARGRDAIAGEQLRHYPKPDLT